jgi:hypothetical protein
MIERCARRGIDPHANEATEQNIAREAGRPGFRDFLGQRDNLRLVSLLADRHGDIGITFGLDHGMGLRKPWGYRDR